MVEKTISHWKKVDILIVNSGEYVRWLVTELTKADFEHSFAGNFYSALYSVLSIMPHMLEHNSGHIVFVNSLDAKKGLPKYRPYVAVKFALTGFIEVRRQELRGSAIHVTTVLPGRIDTPMIKNTKVPWISRKVPPEKVARAIIRGI